MPLIDHLAIARDHRAALIGVGATCSPVAVGDDGAASFTVSGLRGATSASHVRTFTSDGTMVISDRRDAAGRPL